MCSDVCGAAVSAAQWETKMIRVLGAVLCAVALTTVVETARAVDHNNVDAGRPLSFDDAESVAQREQSIETGVSVNLPRTGSSRLLGELEYLYGFARNSHFSVGVEPSLGGRSDDERRFERGDVELGVLHNFNREYRNVPALSLRGDAYLPTGSDSRGVDFRLRGIASKSVAQYVRMHVNLDLSLNNRAARDQKHVVPGVVLGFTRPLGMPRRFDRTGLAEIALRGSDEKHERPVLSVGLGLRQQIGLRSVFDVGVQSDVTGRGDRLRLIAGYSAGF
jgi:hypothetical protein